jgi:hypothetical protein
MNRAQQFMESLSMKTPCDVSCDPQPPIERWSAKWASGAEPVPTVKPVPSIDPATAMEASAGAEPALGIAQIIELILKDRRRLDRLARLTPQRVDLASRLLAISLTSFALFGLAMSLTFFSAQMWPQLASIVRWLNGAEPHLLTFVADTAPSSMALRAARLICAYCFGLIAATGVCLPSLYFYGLLSGLRMSLADVAIHSLKGTAVTAVALIGILPIYSALALGVVVFRVPWESVEAILMLGMWLPFIAGLWGTQSLFIGFTELCGTMPIEFQAQRACFLRRLILSWCACYMAVAPLMIHTVWQNLGS